jgi:hypothetical protein
MNSYFSDFFQNKPAIDKTMYLIKVRYKGKEQFQVWHKYDGKQTSEGDGELVYYEYIKSFISYYDWRGGKFKFMDRFETHYPNTVNEQVYLNMNIRLLKMGATEPPVNALGMLFRGKKLEFVNISGLILKGRILFSSLGNLSFHNCAVDNLSCSELEMPTLKFHYSSIRNIQIRNSNISHWLFYNCNTTGNIIDSKLEIIRIWGGQFIPTFTNSEIDKVFVNHKEYVADDNFEKTYRTLAKSAKDAGNKILHQDLKIKEFNFIRDKTKGYQKLFMTIDRIYWGYGQKPKRLIFVMALTILFFGVIYSFFPNNFSDNELANKNYFEILYNTEYYSVVTFTTLGYGDLSPKGIIKGFAAIEALFGAITLGFLVAGLTKND